VADRLLEDLKTEKAPADDAATPDWNRVAQEMARISKQLPEPKASGDTLAAQDNLIRQLTRLLEKSSTDSTAAPTSSAKSPVGANQNANASQNSNRPGDDQNQGATKAGAVGDKTAESPISKTTPPDVLMRRAWGQLPGRVRERLQSSTPEQFHKKYHAETEAYFRKLSEKEHRP
jgi:hypothetical protein